MLITWPHSAAIHTKPESDGHSGLVIPMFCVFLSEERKVYSRFQMQLEEDGGGSTGKSWMEPSTVACAPPEAKRLKSSQVYVSDSKRIHCKESSANCELTTAELHQCQHRQETAEITARSNLAQTHSANRSRTRTQRTGTTPAISTSGEHKSNQRFNQLQLISYAL